MMREVLQVGGQLMCIERGRSVAARKEQEIGPPIKLVRGLGPFVPVGERLLPRGVTVVTHPGEANREVWMQLLANGRRAVRTVSINGEGCLRVPGADAGRELIPEPDH